MQKQPEGTHYAVNVAEMCVYRAAAFCSHHSYTKDDCCRLAKTTYCI